MRQRSEKGNRIQLKRDHLYSHMPAHNFFHGLTNTLAQRRRVRRVTSTHGGSNFKSMKFVYTHRHTRVSMFALRAKKRGSKKGDSLQVLLLGKKTGVSVLQMTSTCTEKKKKSVNRIAPHTQKPPIHSLNNINTLLHPQKRKWDDNE